ncbi:MAG: stage V sporulation protein AE [Eubacterium sp.]|nr:stage V sporulation protein AE [Eubacterium sp.]MDD7208882.1 stage V sporulation protein AE [Lachnospiraceae bacterium]MDY5496555.1 stage V sporulation protein AE [Anaerobutyricum sp.]
MVYFKAFVVGGLICSFVQIFLDKTKLMPGRVMVLLVIGGVLLGALGIYEPFLRWAGCGASVPLSGFGYNLSKGVMEAVNDEGFIGLFKGGLKAAAAGTSAALIFSYLAAIIFQPKMKK